MDVLQGGRRFISRRSILPGYYELHRNLPLLLLLLLLLLPSRSLEILIISWIERFRHILRTLKVTYILFHACIFIFKSKGRRRLPWMLINFVISRVWIKHDILRFLTSPAIFTVFVKPRVFRRRWRGGGGGGTSTVVKPENQLPITPLGKAPTLRVRPTEYNGSYGVVHRDSEWVQFVVISIHRNFKDLIFFYFLSPLCEQFVRKITIFVIYLSLEYDTHTFFVNPNFS